jgi:hypothetical protein
MILGGTDRVNFQVRRANLARFGNGGVSSTAKIRIHVQCLQEFLSEAAVPSFRDQCVDCHRRIDVSQCKSTLSAHMGILCAECGNTPRWEMCKVCGYYVRKYRMSRIIGTTNEGWITADYARDQTYVCDSCMQPGRYGSEWIITARKVSQDKKKEQLLEKKIEQIKQEPCLTLPDNT